MTEAVEITGFDRIARGVLYAVGHHNKIAAVLIQQFIGFEHQRFCCHVPQHLVDADLVAKALARQRVAQAYQIHRIAVDGSDIDNASEWDGNAGLDVEAIERIDDVDILAIGNAHRAIRLGQIDVPERVLGKVGFGKSVAGKRARGWTGKVEAYTDAGRQSSQRRKH